MAFQIRQVRPTSPLILCFILILVGKDTQAANRQDTFDVLINTNSTSTTLFAGTRANITFTIIDIPLQGEFTLTLDMEDQAFFELEFTELQDVRHDQLLDMNAIMEVTIIGLKLGISEFDLVATDNDEEKQTVLTHYVKVKRVPSRVGIIIRYIVVVAAIFSIWLIGLTTDVHVINSILKRPYALIIGMICQFIIMPFTAWSLAKIFKIDGAAALGLILDGSSPGGTNSNLFSVMLDVDFILSITMTTCSIILALAMMPLNILIYGRSFISAGVKIQPPILQIFIQLLLIVIPLGIGIIVSWKWPKMKEFGDKYIKPVAAVLVIVLLCTDLPFNLYIFDSPWQYYITATIFPLIGATVGFILSRFARLSRRRSVTVALETGVQNALIAITALFFFYPPPEADLATRIPYLILIFTTFEGIALSLVYNLLKKFYWHGVPYDDLEDDKTPSFSSILHKCMVCFVDFRQLFFAKSGQSQAELETGAHENAACDMNA